MIIDLDAERTPEVAPRPGSVRRRVLTAGLALSLLLTLTLTGSGQPPGSVLRPLFSVPATIADEFTLAGDHLFVQTDANTGVAAYRLPDGRRLWSAPVATSDAALQVVSSAGVLLVQNGDPQSVQGQVAAMDADTGRLLWRSTETSLQLDQDSGHVLLMPLDPTGNHQLRSVDPRTGAPLWSDTVITPPKYITLGRGMLMIASFGGRTQVIDEATGRVLADRQLLPQAFSDVVPAPVVSPAPDGPALFAVGQQLITTYTTADVTVVDAYRPESLTRLWELKLDDLVFSVTDCGPVVCLNGAQSLTAVAAATGTIRWRSVTRTIAVSGWGRWLLGTAATDVPGQGRFALLDPATGAPRAEIDDWLPMSRSSLAAPALLTHSQVGRLGTWIGIPGADGSVVRPLGFLPDVVNQCTTDRSGRNYLVCPTRTGPVRVWTYQP